jgi:hypothetical protein
MIAAMFARISVVATLKHGDLLAFNRADLNLIGVIHQGLCDCLY